MSMKRALFVVVVVLLAVAYVAGYWPEHRRLVDASAQAAALETRLSAAEARVRLGEVLGRLLRLSDAVDARNFGEAAEMSSGYFDLVRQEALRTSDAQIRQMLEQLLQGRDAITAALARTDPSASATLREQALKVRAALGYPVGAARTEAAAP